MIGQMVLSCCIEMILLILGQSQDNKIKILNYSTDTELLITINQL